MFRITKICSTTIHRPIWASAKQVVRTMSDKGIGTVSGGTYIQWKIPDFFTLAADTPYQIGVSLVSPALLSHGGWWQLMVKSLSIIDLEKQDLCIGVVCKDYVTAPKEIVTVYIGSERADSREEYIPLSERDPETGQRSSKRSSKRMKPDKFAFWRLYAPFSLDYLEKRKSELVPSGALTITIYIGDDEPQPPRTDVQQLKGLQNLSANLDDFFGSEKKTDVTLKVQEKDFAVHKAVLAARSSVFSAMFEHDTTEEQTGVVVVSDCDPDSFQDFLRYLYTGKFDCVTSSNAHHLYVTAGNYDVQALQSFCVDHMIENLAVENILEFVRFAERYEDSKLMCSVQGFFNRNFSEIVSSSRWKTLLKDDSELANKLLEKMA